MRARPVQLLIAVLALTSAMSTPAYAAKPPAASASLSMPSSALTGSAVTASVSVSDPRLEPGRAVQLEQQAGAGWSVVATTTLPASGTAGLTITAPAAAATYSYRASLPATKKSASLVTAVSTITVSLPPPVVSTTPPPTAVVGTPYSFTFRTTDDRAGTWRLDSVALPPGLTLSTAGVLSGTPTGDALDAPETVVFTGTDGQTASYRTTVSVRRSQPAVSTATPPDATIGVAYSYTFTTADNRADVTWRVSDGALPFGLSMDSNGTVTGTPTTTSPQGANTNYYFELTVTDPKAVTTTTKAIRGIYVRPAPTQ